MKTFIRGTEVLVSTIFYDSSGDIAEPAVVNVEFTYLECCSEIPRIIALGMVNVDGTWSVPFDSAVAAPGLVTWTAISDTLETNSGRFALTAGFANAVAVPCDPEFYLAAETGEELITEDDDFLILETVRP
jgi:hypothetical protein